MSGFNVELMLHPSRFRSVLIGGATATAVLVTVACAAPVRDVPTSARIFSAERPACAACHMADGSGQPEVGIPRLAGQSADYMAKQLDYFADGRRGNIVMHPYAAALSDNEKQSFAKYFAASSTSTIASPFPPTEALLARGQQLFANGDVRTGLVACAQCHGPTGLGVGDFSPRLAGQSAVYIVEQLRDWHAGAMRDPDGKYMSAIAVRLSPDDMKSVAAYIATMKTMGSNSHD